MNLGLGIALILFGVLLRAAGLGQVSFFGLCRLSWDAICILAGVIRIITGLAKEEP